MSLEDTDTGPIPVSPDERTTVPLRHAATGEPLPESPADLALAFAFVTPGKTTVVEVIRRAGFPDDNTVTWTADGVTPAIEPSERRVLRYRRDGAEVILVFRKDRLHCALIPAARWTRADAEKALGTPAIREVANAGSRKLLVWGTQGIAYVAEGQRLLTRILFIPTANPQGW